MAEERAGRGRLSDAAVCERLTRLDSLLEQVEAVPGPAGEVALAAVSAMAELYGEALARTVEHAAAEPDLLDAFAEDELLGHLFALHEVHPDPLERRIERTLDRLRPEIAKRGGEVELAGFAGGVATLRLSLTGCSAAPVEEALREAVRAAAPELTDVTVAPAGGGQAAFVPLASLTSRARPSARSGATP